MCTIYINDQAVAMKHHNSESSRGGHKQKRKISQIDGGTLDASQQLSTNANSASSPLGMKLVEK